MNIAWVVAGLIVGALAPWTKLFTRPSAPAEPRRVAGRRVGVRGRSPGKQSPPARRRAARRRVSAGA